MTKMVTERQKIFWEKVENCKHGNADYTDACSIIRCPTPYCSGDETKCLDCGAYIIKCDCGFMNSVSGWSMARLNRYQQKKENKNVQ